MSVSSPVSLFTHTRAADKMSLPLLKEVEYDRARCLLRDPEKKRLDDPVSPVQSGPKRR